MSPKLDRTFAMFEAVEAGLRYTDTLQLHSQVTVAFCDRDCISLTQADIATLTSSIDDALSSPSSQVRLLLSPSSRAGTALSLSFSLSFPVPDAGAGAEPIDQRCCCFRDSLTPAAVSAVSAVASLLAFCLAINRRAT